MSETKQQTDAAIATLKTIAEILPAAMLSTDDVQILKMTLTRTSWTRCLVAGSAAVVCLLARANSAI
jgi:hypothetical protein